MAERLGLECLDTGAMYRLVAWALKESGREHLEGEALRRFLAQLDFRIQGSGPGQRVWFKGKDISQEIRGPEISQLASTYSMKAEVRSVLTEKQRAAGRRGGLVAEGRDMGTVVFPQADFKFFLEASPEVRARRRYKELIQRGQPVSLASVREEMEIRDRQDQERHLAPLRPAPDAVRIDTTHLSIEEVVDRICDHIRRGKGDPSRG